ncbi:MAG TPA: trigger factor [Candidatus Paceibacterota bacterium]|nr:trigger factor [Candidatus Paceibacterota bacterium]
MKINIKKLPKSEAELEGELEAEAFEQYFDKALKKIGETFEMDGFRKGKVPENILLAKVPGIRILEEAASQALSELYPKVIEEHKLDAIGRPEISITKLARKNPLGFKIKTALLPEVKLPDYKELAKKILAEVAKENKDLTVTDKEMEDTIMDIRKSRAPRKPMSEAAREGAGAEEVKEELPAFDDEFVRSLGPFKDVTDFKTKLRENIKLEKENMEKEKTRLKMIEKIIEKSEVEMPELLVEAELDKILYRMESDVSQMGLRFEDYLKHLKKSAEELRKDFRGDAEKKAKLGLVLNKIAAAEKILADETEVAQEVEHILEHYKDADPERAAAYAENVITNEKVFKFLEGQK